MQFALICRDAPGTLPRRLAARSEHMAGIHRLKAEGRIIDGGAILSETGEMSGSVVLCDFADEAALREWLATEPYVRDGVWQDIEILPFRRVDWATL